MAHPWDESPIWTTVDAVKAAAPYVMTAARSRVASSQPPDLDVAADAFIATNIVRAQAYLIGGIQRVYDGPESIATTYATTPGDLRRYTTDRAIVEIQKTDTGRNAAPGIVRMEEEVDEWLAGLRMGHQFLATTGPDDAAAPRSTPPRRSRRPCPGVARMTKLCTTCCSSDPPKTITPGSWPVTIVLLLMGVIPGLLYECWRITARHKACRHCGNRTFAPRDSPIFRGRTC